MRFAIIPRLVTIYKMDEESFRLLGTNAFHVKSEIERFTAAGSRFRQNLKKIVNLRRRWTTQQSNAGHAQMGTYFGSCAPISRTKI